MAKDKKKKNNNKKKNNKNKNKNKTKNDGQQGESSKNAAASSQNGTPTAIEDVQATPAMGGPAYSFSSDYVSPIPEIPMAVYKHRHMVYYLLHTNITSEVQERGASAAFVTKRNASEQVAVERIATFFGVRLNLEDIAVSDYSEQDTNENNENIRNFIREGLLYRCITEHDIKCCIAEQIVPFEGNYPGFSQIQEYLADRGVHFVYHQNSVSGGSDPGSTVKKYMARNVPGEIIEVNESPNTYNAEEQDSQANIDS